VAWWGAPWPSTYLSTSHFLLLPEISPLHSSNPCFCCSCSWFSISLLSPSLLLRFGAFVLQNGWSLMEDELDAYMEEHPQHTHKDGEGTDSAQPSSTWGSSYQQSYFDYGPCASSSWEPDYGHATNDPPA
jgi:hypothetical protein